MVEMEVVGVVLEPNSNRPLVCLKDKDQRVFLPIAIGNFEATAIYMEYYDEPPPRPITHDLLRSILDGLDARVDRVVINALKDDTFYAEITLQVGDRAIQVDSRPSDAIALALRVEAPIFVAKEVIQEAGLPVDKQPDEGDGLELPEPESVTEDGVCALKVLDGRAGGVEERVVTLKAKLQEAVDQEEYEEAAKLRDEIGRLQHLDG